MQIKTFKIPLGGGEMEEELNRFLRGHRVLKVERAFCLVLRGGSWNNNARNCRVANRNNNNPDNRNNNNGLRLAQ